MYRWPHKSLVHKDVCKCEEKKYFFFIFRLLSLVWQRWEIFEWLRELAIYLSIKHQFSMHCMQLHVANNFALKLKRTNTVFFSLIKAIMQGKLFQRCTHLLYCSVLSLGGNVNTRRMLQPDMGSIFHIKKINEIFWS